MAFAALIGALPAGAQERVAIDLVTHSEVTIDRPATAIWPHIVDPSAWKQGAKLVHHAGPAGTVGEVFAAAEPSAPATVAFFVENVELEPNRPPSKSIMACS